MAEASGPFVLQCNKCRSILGDSLSWVGAEESLNTVSVRAAPGVKPVVDFITARTGPDQGSSYMPIACNFCDERLGRVYQTTPQALDHLRGQFTFDTDKITSYVLGTGADDFPTPTAAGTASDSALNEEVTEIQKVILVLSERINELHARMDQVAPIKRPRTAG